MIDLPITFTEWRDTSFDGSLQLLNGLELGDIISWRAVANNVKHLKSVPYYRGRHTYTTSEPPLYIDTVQKVT